MGVRHVAKLLIELYIVPPSETFLPSVIASVVAALALLLLPVIFWVIRKKNPKAGEF